MNKNTSKLSYLIISLLSSCYLSPFTEWYGPCVVQFYEIVYIYKKFGKFIQTKLLVFKKLVLLIIHERFIRNFVVFVYYQLFVSI